MANDLVRRYDTREAWLQARTIGIGASESPAILGVSPYKSALQLYYEKTGTEPITFGEKEALQWGKVLEQPIAKRYAEETGRTVVFDEAPFVIRQHPDLDFMIATIDAGVSGFGPDDQAARGLALQGHGTLEIKNVNSYVGQRWTGPQEPPVEFMVQLQHQLLVTGDQWGSIAALIGGVFFVWADIRRDDEFIGLLVRDVEAFVQRVRDRRPPPADDSTMTAELLQRLYPREKARTIQLPVDLEEPVAKWLQIKAEIKDLESKKRGFENALRDLMGEANLAQLPNGDQFTLKTRKEYTVQPFTVKASRLLKFIPKKGPKRIAGRPAPLELTAGEEESESNDE